VRGSKTPRKLDSEELFEYAVQCLGRRPYAAEELKTKLRTRAARVADVDAAITRLKDVGYLDDKRFAESFALNRAENDGFGKMRVLSDLRARRVAPKLAEKAVAQVFEDRSESAQIEAYIERRMPSLRASRAEGRIEDARELARGYRRLRRAGFSSGAALAALKRVAARPEEIEEPLEEETEE
jgi:regulatory protein